MEHPIPTPPADVLRILRLKVATPAGEALLDLPGDMTAFQLEPILTAGDERADADRTVAAQAEAGEADLLEVPLAQALRSAENAEGAGSLLLEVQTAAETLSFRIECLDVHEPRPHTPYPLGIDAEGQRLVERFHAHEEPDWFCDSSSTLACCESARTSPHQWQWVSV